MDVQTPVRAEGRHFRRRSSLRRAMILSLAAAVLFLLVASTLALVLSERTSVARPGPLSAGVPGVAAEAPRKVGDEAVRRILDEAEDCRIGIAVVDAKGGTVREYGDQSAFMAASTAKILTAAAYYRLVETGKASLDEQVGDYSAAFQLRDMINHSNNDSWLHLMERVGYRALTEYAASIGVTYDPEENSLTPADMARVLAKLHSGELLNPRDTRELLGYMQETNDEELIPAALEPGITVFHKYGQLGGLLHDAALLTSGGTAYAVVIYTESADATDERGRVEIIHNLTRTLVDALFP